MSRSFLDARIRVACDTRSYVADSAIVIARDDRAHGVPRPRISASLANYRSWTLRKANAGRNVRTCRSLIIIKERFGAAKGVAPGFASAKTKERVKTILIVYMCMFVYVCVHVAFLLISLSLSHSLLFLLHKEEARRYKIIKAACDPIRP